MKTFAAIVIVSATLFCSADALAADRVQAGEWETTMTGIGPSPMVTKYCISAKEAKAMSGDLATLRKFVTESTAEKTGGRCSVKDVELKGNRGDVVGKIDDALRQLSLTEEGTEDRGDGDADEDRAGDPSNHQSSDQHETE